MNLLSYCLIRSHADILCILPSCDIILLLLLYFFGRSLRTSTVEGLSFSSSLFHLHRWTGDRGQACRQGRIATGNPTLNNSVVRRYVCFARPRLVITQSKALRYQIRLRSIPARTSSSLSGENSLESGTESGKDGEVSMKVNVSSPNHFANFFARSFAYSFVMSSSIAISYTPEYQVENLSPVHM